MSWESHSGWIRAHDVHLPVKSRLLESFPSSRIHWSSHIKNAEPDVLFTEEYDHATCERCSK